MYVMTGGSNAQMFQAMLLGPWLFRNGGQKVGKGGAGPNQKDLAFVGELLAAGQVAPVIDRCFPLDQVPDAIRYVEAGHARGKVVITISQN
jgi:NADPH:quinone reductase-like Zn-dependent oxidoreductase